MASEQTVREEMEARIHEYIDACNRGDVAAISATLTQDAVHYFPPGMYDGPWRGAGKIAEKWRVAVETLGSQWTVDAVACDTDRRVAVAEWTHFKVNNDVMLRGCEWYEFDDRLLIREIRAYYASPQDPGLRRLELGGFDYEARSYPLAAS